MEDGGAGVKLKEVIDRRRRKAKVVRCCGCRSGAVLGGDGDAGEHRTCVDEPKQVLEVRKI